MNLKTRCPKRIVEGGLEGCRDLGNCIDTCAAFDLRNALNNNEGMCNEYHVTVNADTDQDQILALRAQEQLKGAKS